MTWEEFRQRCRDGGWGDREEFVHMIVFAHLRDLGWLRHLEFFYEKPPYSIGTGASCYLYYTLRDDNDGYGERLFLFLDPRTTDGCRSVLGRARIERKYPGEAGWPNRYCYPSSYSHCCATDDPVVLELWLRRLPVDWSTLG